MALAGWTVSYWNGTAFVLSTEYLPFPWSTVVNEDVNIKVKGLADGSRGKTQPSTNSWTTINFIFGNMDNTEYGIWRTYMQNQTILKLVDLNSRVYYGTFIKFDREEKSVSGQINFWISAIFEESPDPS